MNGARGGRLREDCGHICPPCVAMTPRAHESPRTTKLYDRTGDEITLDEVERITI